MCNENDAKPFLWFFWTFRNDCLGMSQTASNDPKIVYLFAKLILLHHKDMCLARGKKTLSGYIGLREEQSSDTANFLRLSQFRAKINNAMFL